MSSDLPNVHNCHLQQEMSHSLYFQLSEEKLRTPDIWEIENKKKNDKRQFGLNKDDMKEERMTSWVPITESPV